MPRYIDTYRLALELLELTQDRLAHVSRRDSLAELWASMSFCILSSSVRLDAAVSAHRSVLASPCLFSDFCCTDDLESQIRARLIRSRYRFYNAKSSQLSRSWFVLQTSYTDLADMLRGMTDAISIRDYLVAMFPGLGIKQASMFLRDVGATSELAIIDVHIKRFLAQHVADFDPASRREYLLAETWLGDIAKAHRSSVAAVDLAIWAASKTLGAAKTC